MQFTEEQLALIRLSNSSVFNFDKIFKIFLESHCSAIATIDKINYYKKINKINFALCETQEVKKELDEMRKINASFLFCDDEHYPKLLKKITDFPFCLRCIGNPNTLKEGKLIAIVGTREPDNKSARVTKKITQKLANNNFIVVSGFAKGVDTIVHENSFQTGTIAVIGAGLNQIYPKTNQVLFENIVANNGLIVSEFPVNQVALPINFPRRNRIIAGLVKNIIISQAKLKSGTLITARLANEYNRNVYSIPGDLEDANYFGNNYLVANNNAILIESLETLVEQINAESYLLF
jgi:DNA processing protein